MVQLGFSTVKFVSKVGYLFSRQSLIGSTNDVITVEVAVKCHFDTHSRLNLDVRGLNKIVPPCISSRLFIVSNRTSIIHLINLNN